MEIDYTKRLETIEGKIDAIYVSVEKTRKYFFWTMIVTLVVFILPLIGMMFAIPAFIKSYSGSIQGVEGLM